MNEKSKQLTFDQLPIYSLGDEITISGLVLQGQGKTFGLLMPLADHDDIDPIPMSLEEWKRFLHQVDYLEKEMFPNSTDPGLLKTIIRKSQRNIESQIQWNVFRRDDYICRYCGANDVPLTVDHIVLWEDLGQSVEDNLISACRKCNKNRGNTPYLIWLNKPHYTSKMLKWLGDNWSTSEQHLNNVKAWELAEKLPPRAQQRNR